jgi:hypothetical protein
VWFLKIERMERLPVKPREHPFKMKYLAAQLALQDPVRFFEKFGPQGDGRFFADLWTACGEELDPVQRVSNAGASVWRSEVTPSSQDMIVLCFPAPQAQSEAWFIGVVRVTEAHCRVFCLERAAEIPDQKEPSMLLEFAPHGRMNWGTGPRPVLEDFVARVRTLVSDAAAAPLSFFPVRLA